MPPPDDCPVFKVLLVGDSAVGKSSIMTRFTDDTFEEDGQPTIGVDFKIKQMTANGKKVKLTIWDTAGQERFRTLTSSYYRGAHGIVLCYDTTRRETFEHIQAWAEEVDLYATHGEAVRMIIGNKIDKEGERQVTRREGEAYARKLSTLFIECSAKTKVGIEQVFEELVLKILDTPSLVKSAMPQGMSSVNMKQKNDAGADGGCGC